MKKLISKSTFFLLLISALFSTIYTPISVSARIINLDQPEQIYTRLGCEYSTECFLESKCEEEKQEQAKSTVIDLDVSISHSYCDEYEDYMYYSDYSDYYQDNYYIDYQDLQYLQDDVYYSQDNSSSTYQPDNTPENVIYIGDSQSQDFSNSGNLGSQGNYNYDKANSFGIKNTTIYLGQPTTVLSEEEAQARIIQIAEKTINTLQNVTDDYAKMFESEPNTYLSNPINQSRYESNITALKNEKNNIHNVLINLSNCSDDTVTCQLSANEIASVYQDAIDEIINNYQYYNEKGNQLESSYDAPEDAISDTFGRLTNTFALGLFVAVIANPDVLRFDMEPEFSLITNQ